MRTIFCVHCGLQFTVEATQRAVICGRCDCAFDISNVAWPVPSISGQDTEPPPPPAPPRPTHFFQDASSVVALIETSLGRGLKIQELTVYDKYVCFDAQDPHEPENVDSYTLREGKITKGRPVTFTGSRSRLESTLMGLDEIPFEMLPRLCADAIDRLKIPGGTPSHVIVNRFAADGRANRLLSVYVNSERKGSGYVDYDLHGRVRSVSSP
jgi:hypothetical protein